MNRFAYFIQLYRGVMQTAAYRYVRIGRKFSKTWFISIRFYTHTKSLTMFVMKMFNNDFTWVKNAKQYLVCEVLSHWF